MISKRVFDLLAALAGLILLLPLLLIVALAVSIDSSGPVIFRQTRTGRGGKPFTLFKFRTMRTGTPNLSTEQMRRSGPSPVTTTGALLRRTSIDELPQLVNVLKGEMSLIGPRPALPSQSRLNTLRSMAGVEDLRPGLTGWAQVNGRDDLTDEAKAAFDSYYRERACFSLDLIILARTVRSAVSGRGNY